MRVCPCGKEIKPLEDIKVKNLYKRKFCLECLPVGSRDMRLVENALKYGYDKNTHKICGRCGIVKELETGYYKKHKGEGFCSYCKSCLSEISTDGQKDRKKKAVEYKGGKCEKCGYDKCLAAFDFHHLDPNEKDYEPSRLFGQNHSWETIKSELDKCALLCANCHRETHNEEKSVLSEKLRNRARSKVNDLNWPDTEVLKKMGAEMSCSEIADKLKISQESVIRKFKIEGISMLKRDRAFKIIWPSNEVIMEMISSMSIIEIGRKLGVSDNSVRRHCKRNNIKYK